MCEERGEKVYRGGVVLRLREEALSLYIEKQVVVGCDWCVACYTRFTHDEE